MLDLMMEKIGGRVKGPKNYGGRGVKNCDGLENVATLRGPSKTKAKQVYLCVQLSSMFVKKVFK